jgi:hypothetical protein
MSQLSKRPRPAGNRAVELRTPALASNRYQNHIWLWFAGNNQTPEILSVPFRGPLTRTRRMVKQAPDQGYDSTFMKTFGALLSAVRHQHGRDLHLDQGVRRNG